ncbi:MAG: hypothetical protein HRT58_05150 [Crocinitomicaceae bacterium]|nr:hypothetical protein [Flavobacteriales bacterium]NQZ35026.1 hypothetical protein [Crocinitomicaceae bacterium]
MKINLLVLILLLSGISFAQNETDWKLTQPIDGYYNYSWDETFDKSKYDSIDHVGKEATIVLDETILTHRPRSASKNLPFRRKITHQIYWIHEESAIEKMNEVYLRQSGNSRVKKVLVRTIDKTGKVVEFDDANLENVTKNEGGSSYKILAIPGIEVGSWVEVLIIYNGFSNQSRILTREPFDVIESQVIYISALPSQEQDGVVNPKIIASNGYELESKDTLDKGRVAYTYKASNIPAQITDEAYMHEYIECPKVDLTTDIYIWSEISYGIHRNYMALEMLNQSGKVKKLIDKIGAGSGTELDKIIAIERYIKEDLTVTEEDGLDFESSSRIIKNKVVNTKGTILMYKTLFENCDIVFQPYIAFDKDYISPIKEMPMTLGLSDFIFYFPNSDVYIKPESNYYRAGKLANYLGGVSALYLKDNFSQRDGDYLITFPSAEKEYNVDKSVNRVSYNEDDESLTIQTSKRYYGDRAIIERGALNFMDDSEQKEHIEEALLSKMENATLTNVKTDKTEIGFNANSKDTVLYTGTIVTEDMLSPIGNGFLLNLSKVIGNQVSFYQEGERIHSVYSRAAKIYEHTIEFVIPDGYKVQGIENLVFDRNYYSAVAGESKHISSFVSTAEIVDGVLKVEVHEFYEEGLFPKKEIDQYKSVVNAAYEFYIAQIKVVQI